MHRENLPLLKMCNMLAVGRVGKLPFELELSSDLSSSKVQRSSFMAKFNFIRNLVPEKVTFSQPCDCDSASGKFSWKPTGTLFFGRSQVSINVHCKSAGGPLKEGSPPGTKSLSNIRWSGSCPNLTTETGGGKKLQHNMFCVAVSQSVWGN